MPLDPGRVRPRAASRWWGAVTVMSVGFALLAAGIAAPWEPLLNVDTTVATEAYERVIGHSGTITMLRVVAAAASPEVFRLLLLGAAVFLIRRRALRLCLWVVVTIVVEAALAVGLKRVFDRSRPLWDDPITTVGGFSFPSGHAAGGGMFAVAAVLLAVTTMQRSRLRSAVCALAVAAGVAAGLDRVLLGVHYVSDVVAGWLLGAAVVSAAWVLVVRPAIWTPPTLAERPGPQPSRFAVIANPLRVADMPAFRHSVVAAAGRWGWEPPLWLETEADDNGIGMAEQALLADVQMVLVVGGDGTVRVVCSELARTGVAVGVVPLGTGNLLARNLGLPLNPADAVEVALSGQDRAVDVVEVTGDDLTETCFTVMAGLGLDAAIMAGAPDQLKARMGWPAYVVSALRQLRHPATWVEVSVDGSPPVRRKVRTVVIGNVGSLQARIPLLPDALIDDGRLDVVVIAPQHTVGWLRLALRVLRRTRRTDERLDRMTGRRVSIRADKPLLRQLDGDPVGEGRELNAEVLAGTLLVRVPR